MSSDENRELSREEKSRRDVISKITKVAAAVIAIPTISRLFEIDSVSAKPTTDNLNSESEPNEVRPNLPQSPIPKPNDFDITTSNLPIPPISKFVSEGAMNIDSGKATKITASYVIQKSKDTVENVELIKYLKRYKDGLKPVRIQVLNDFKFRDYFWLCLDNDVNRFDRRGNGIILLDKEGNLTNQSNSNTFPHEDDLQLNVTPVGNRGIPIKITRPGDYTKYLEYCWKIGDRKHPWQERQYYCEKRWNARWWLGSSPNDEETHLITTSDFLAHGSAFPSGRYDEIAVNPYNLVDLPVSHFLGHLDQSFRDLNIPHESKQYIEGVRGDFYPHIDPRSGWTPFGHGNALNAYPKMKGAYV